MGSMSELFHELKPICVSLTRNASKDNLNIALDYLKKLDNSAIKDEALLQYIVFPFKIILKKGNLNEEQDILLFHCLEKLVEKTESSVITKDFLLWSLNTFSLYFTTKEMLFQAKEVIDVFDGVAKKSEEQKLRLVAFLATTLQKCSDQVLFDTYSKRQLPMIGHIISVLIKLAEQEKNFKLQVSAIHCMKVIAGCNTDYEMHLFKLGNFIASFFPGIALFFTTLITKDKLQSSKTIISGLEFFRFVMYIIFHIPNYGLYSHERPLDYQLLPVLGSMNDDGTKGQFKRAHVLTVTRDKKWVKESAKHMENVFNTVLPVLIIHENVNVRKELLDLIDMIMVQCMDTLSKSITSFLDVLAKFSSDDYEDIRKKSKIILESATERFHSQGNKDLMVILQDRLQSQVLSLPRIMNGSNDDLKLAHLHTLKGYLSFFGQQFQQYLYSSYHLETFFSALLQVLEFRTKNITIVEERTNVYRQAIEVNDSTELDNHYCRKEFLYFTSSNVLKAFKDIIKLVVKNGDIDLIIDHLLKSCIQDTRLVLQSVFILNEVVFCIGERKDFDTSEYVEQVIETYLEDDLWKLPLSNDYLLYYKNDDGPLSHGLSLTENRPNISNAIPFEILNKNIQLTCLLLEGLACHSSILQTNYNIFLMKTLYPILEKVGSVNSAVSRAAMQSLSDISRNCYYESIGDLLLINSDYLINSVTLQFRHLVYGSAAPCVLAVILKLCNSDVMPIICDAIEDVFLTLDDYQEDIAEEMLNVLKYFSIAVDKWYNTIKPEEKLNRKPITTDVTNDNISLGKFMFEYIKLSSQAAGNVDESEDDSCVNNEEEIVQGMDEDYEQNEDKNKSETPKHFQIVINSLEKCVYYVAANQNNVRLKALDVVYFGVVALKKRENDLLPVLHKLWPTLMQRLKETNLVIVLKALDVVSCMVSFSSDFLRKRISTEFIPIAMNFLTSHKDSYTKNKSQYTQTHKVINKLVTFLSDVLQHLDISTKQFCDVASVCSLYLNCNLHNSVQVAAVEATLKLSQVQPDVIWILLLALSTRELNPPNDNFPAIVCPAFAIQRNVYSDNVLKIFKKIIT